MIRVLDNRWLFFMHCEANEMTATSWSHLNDCLYEGSWDDNLGRFRSSIAFRGLSDASYELKTGLCRLGGDLQRLERHLIRNFRKYAHADAVPADSVWNWLARAQHHGLPTRLLDWTFSPYVAMHFATANIERFNVPGVIWCVDYFKAHRLLPVGLKEALDKEGANLLTAELLSQVVATLSEFDALAPPDFVVFLEPASLDQRIVNQYALFSLMSNPMGTLDGWLAAHPGLFRRIIVPPALKPEIRDKLDQANMTERVLFPGLDGLSRWLARHYSLRAKFAGAPTAGPALD